MDCFKTLFLLFYGVSPCLLYSEGKLYSSTSLYFQTFAFHIEVTPASRRNLRAHPGARRGFLWSPDQLCGFNWSSKPRFGCIKVYWLNWHYWRQAPVHNPIISKLCNLLLITCAFKFLELNENLRCIILCSYWLNTRIWVRIAAMLIGLVKVEWLPVTRELYRSWLFIFLQSL